MSGHIGMSQDSPFKETAWDQRLDKMLDDLKTTVSPEGDRTTGRRDNSLVSSFRSTSRSDSRNSNRSAVEDGGLMKHHHKEYTSPDKTTRIVTDQYEYDSGDPKKYQKKVMKSTYSNYKVTGDLTSDLDSLRQGPPASVMASVKSDYQTDSTKVVSASQKVANKLVDALSTIGPDGKPITIIGSATDTLGTQGSDYSTLTRLNRNINELDSMLEDLDKEEKEKLAREMKKTETVTIKEKRIIRNIDLKQTDKRPLPTVPSKVEKREEKVSAIVSDGQPNYSTNYTSNKHTKYTTSGLTNGTSKPSYDDDEVEYIQEPSGGETRKIVWRNRFEKTYDTHESNTPSISIEEAARRRNLQQIYDYKNASSITTLQPQPPQRGPVSPRQLQLQYAVYWPNFSPNISPGGQSWADPIPLPTPPQVSPKGEPGVAYVYSYAQGSGSQVQHLPPLNYVTMPGPSSVHASDGAPSPTPSGSQPIIYHYSYHYTLQPGQSIPEGVPQPPVGPGIHPPQPALQVAPTPIRQTAPPQTVIKSGPTQNSTTTSALYDYKTHSSTHTSNLTNRNETNVIHHHHFPPGGPTDPKDSTSRFPVDSTGPRGPTYGGPVNEYPRGIDPGRTPDGTNRNISITINKNTTHTTQTKEYPGGPSTSTPFPTHGRSRSTSPERYPRGPGGTGGPPYGVITHINRTSYTDSLERLRKPVNEGLPFPDTSPIKPTSPTKIPRRVDDLMTSFSDSEDGPDRGGPRDLRGINGPRSPHEREPLVGTKLNENNTEIAISESHRRAELKKEDSRNVAGPPVYYPPGHHQLFDESMHTMTLKESKRRGMAKWRMEKASGYKESSSSSESKGGMAMVPVCLPLCCGAACAIM